MPNGFPNETSNFFKRFGDDDLLIFLSADYIRKLICRQKKKSQRVDQIGDLVPGFSSL